MRLWKYNHINKIKTGDVAMKPTVENIIAKASQDRYEKNTYYSKS